MTQRTDLNDDADITEAIINSFIIYRLNENMNRAAPYLQDGSLVISELGNNFVEKLLGIGNILTEWNYHRFVDPEILDGLVYGDMFDYYDIRDCIFKIYEDIFSDKVVLWVKIVQLLEWSAKVALKLIGDCGPGCVDQIVHIMLNLMVSGLKRQRKHGGWDAVFDDSSTGPTASIATAPTSPRTSAAAVAATSANETTTNLALTSPTSSEIAAGSLPSTSTDSPVAATSADVTTTNIALTSPMSSKIAVESLPFISTYDAVAANGSGHVIDFSQYQRTDRCPNCGRQKPISKNAVNSCACGTYICMYPDCHFIYQERANALKIHMHPGHYSNRNPLVECVCGYPKQPSGGLKFVKCPNPYCPYWYCRQGLYCDLEFIGMNNDKTRHTAKNHSAEGRAKIDVCGICKQGTKVRDGIATIQNCPVCGVLWCMKFQCPIESSALRHAKRHEVQCHMA